ncbi:hypothetical protein M728_001186 [Ensifer sp. WSM1721]
MGSAVVLSKLLQMHMKKVKRVWLSGTPPGQ